MQTIQTSYNAVHNVSSGGDWEMYTTPVKVAQNITNVGPAIKKNLNGKSLRRSLALRIWSTLVTSFTSSGCNLCGPGDDDDSMERAIWLRAPILDTVTHDRWEAAWCDEMTQYPYGDILPYVYGCTINYTCVPMAAHVSDPLASKKDKTIGGDLEKGPAAGNVETFY